MKLSIIIPCYNVELFVEKCIQSVENQNIPKEDYEVLAYNDGSKDNTLQILEHLDKIHPNLVVASHPNKGLSGTRNRGLREAKGDFIWFVDSDDWIEENCLEDLLNKLDDNIDMLSFNSYISEGGRSSKPQIYSDAVKDKLSLFNEGFTDPVQFYVFKRKFLLDNNFFFEEGIKHEDVRFTPVALYKSTNIVFHKKPLYHFLKREGSITTVTDISRLNDLSKSLLYLYKYSIGISDKEYKLAFQNHISHHLLEMMLYGINNGKNGETILKQIMSEHPEFWSLLRNSMDWKPKLFYWIIRISPLPFITTCKLMCYLRK